jgi:hypothetical protein
VGGVNCGDRNSGIPFSTTEAMFGLISALGSC